VTSPRAAWLAGCLLLLGTPAWSDVGLDLAVDRPTLLQGETLTARVGFTNTGGDPVTLVLPFSIFSVLLTFEVRADGSPEALPPPKFEGPGMGGEEATLAPGERREAPYDLTEMAPLLPSGHYTIRAHYAADGQTADSPEVGVAIEAPSGTATDAFALYRRALLAAERTDVLERAQELVDRFPASRYRPLARLLLLDNFRGLREWLRVIDQATVLEHEGGLSPGERAQVARVRRTAEETLAGGAPCQTSAECDDAVACTDDSCDGGRCRHALVHARCADGDACNGTELCDPAHGCVGGTPVVCTDDGNVCTDDVCDPATGRCGRPNTAACDDGSPCTADRCADGTCVSAAAGGYDGALCELDQLLATPPCGAEPLPRKLQNVLAKQVAKAKPLLDRAHRATKPTKVAKALKGADRSLAAISAAIKKATKSKKTKLSATCAAALGDAVEHSRRLVRGLRSLGVS
jgi:hypothetical protein